MEEDYYETGERFVCIIIQYGMELTIAANLKAGGVIAKTYSDYLRRKLPDKITEAAKCDGEGKTFGQVGYK